MEQNKDQKLPDILLSDEVAQGIYSNLAIIVHSSSEFILDFARILPGQPRPSVKSRIVLTPEHAKRLLMALQDNISNFEKQYGEIRIEVRNNQIPPLSFNTGEA